MRLSFGPFAFDRQSRLLWREGNEVALPPRVLGVLEVLLDRAGQVVARQDLLDGVWKDAFVTDTSLAEAVSFLRQALGDDPQAPTYIQTVHRRGYRFLAPVTADPGLTPAAADRGLTPADATRGRTPDGHFAVASQLRALSATSETVQPSIGWQLLPWSVAILFAAIAAAALWRLTRADPAPEPLPIARFDLRAVEGTAFDRRAAAIAVSADGGTVAWTACAIDGPGCGLYVRRVDRLDAARLGGTDGASAPFFSPDGRWIGFFADGKLKRIAASGGSPAVLADAPSPGGAAWAADGRIAFSGSSAGGLAVVSDQGGSVSTLTMPRIERGEVRHVHPAWLANGALMFTVVPSPIAETAGELAVLPARARDWKVVRTGVTRGTPAGPGHLLLGAGADLQAATFDERTLTLTGSADSVLTSITGGEGIAHFAVGGATLVAVTSSNVDAATWTDGSPAGALGRLSSITISPDGRRAAGIIADGNGSDVWVADIGSGVALRRITYGGWNVSPAWAADGSRIFFATRTTGPYGLASRTIDGREAPRIIPSGTSHVFPSSLSRDGRIAVTTVSRGGHTAAAVIPSSGGDPEVLESGPFNEGAAVFSPDGKWLALESDESGRTEIVVRAADGGRRLPISTEGGTQPRWSADGRYLYYVSGTRVMRAAFDADAGAVRVTDILLDRPGKTLAVTPAGRVLVAQRTAAPGRALVVLQWLRELRQRLPAPVVAPR